MTVDGTSHALPEAFTVFATQNPIEFEGTYPLPEAELDRFLVKVLVGLSGGAGGAGHPRARARAASRRTCPPSYGIAARGGRRGPGRGCATPCAGCGWSRAWSPTSRPSCGPRARAPVLTLGASPRGSVALLKMAQASALLDGRSYVVPDDVKELAPAVLRHRVAVAPELELEGDHARRGAPGHHREDRGATVIVVPSRRWLVGAALLAARGAAGTGVARGGRPAARARPGVAGGAPGRRGPRAGAAHARGRPRGAGRVRRGPRGRRALPLAPSRAGGPLTLEVRERLPDPLGGAEYTDSHGSRCRRARGSTSGWSSRPFAAGRARAAPSPSGHSARSASRGGRRRSRCPGPPRSTRACPTPRSGRCRCRSLRRREAGLRAIRRPGEGRLFEGLREWVPGDETRIIDWKATARRGKPIARQYEDERRQQVLIVIDAGRLLTAEVQRRAAARSGDLGRPAARAGRGGARRQRRPAWSSPTRCSATSRRRAAAARSGRCSTAWPHAEGRLVESDYPAAFRYLAAHNRKRALTVLFTDVIDRTASEALVAHAATLRPRHLPLAVTLRDPALEALAAARPADRGAARSSGRRRRSCSARATRRWPRCGAAASWCWTCRRRAPGRRSSTRYHQLKRRGLL